MLETEFNIYSLVNIFEGSLKENAGIGYMSCAFKELLTTKCWRAFIFNAILSHLKIICEDPLAKHDINRICVVY